MSPLRAGEGIHRTPFTILFPPQASSPLLERGPFARARRRRGENEEKLRDQDRDDPRAVTRHVPALPCHALDAGRCQPPSAKQWFDAEEQAALNPVEWGGRWDRICLRRGR